MITPQTPLHLYNAVDSYSPLCPYSFFKEPDFPADRRKRVSPSRKTPFARSPRNNPAIFDFRFELQRQRLARCLATAVIRQIENRNSKIENAFPGGADGIRTHDLLVANQALSQLSYGPFKLGTRNVKRGAQGHGNAVVLVPSSGLAVPRLEWWAQVESNHRPRPYQGRALAN